VRFIRDVFVETYDPTIEGQLSNCWTSDLSEKPLEEYRRTMTVDDQLDSVGQLPYFSALLKIASKLEVLDTAGAEQFNSLNEVYLKVIAPSHCRTRLTAR